MGERPRPATSHGGSPSAFGGLGSTTRFSSGVDPGRRRAIAMLKAQERASGSAELSPSAAGVMAPPSAGEMLSGVGATLTAHRNQQRKQYDEVRRVVCEREQVLAVLEDSLMDLQREGASLGELAERRATRRGPMGWLHIPEASEALDHEVTKRPGSRARSRPGSRASPWPETSQGSTSLGHQPATFDVLEAARPSTAGGVIEGAVSQAAVNFTNDDNHAEIRRLIGQLEERMAQGVEADYDTMIYRQMIGRMERARLGFDPAREELADEAERRQRTNQAAAKAAKAAQREAERAHVALVAERRKVARDAAQREARLAEMRRAVTKIKRAEARAERAERRRIRERYAPKIKRVDEHTVVNSFKKYDGSYLSPRQRGLIRDAERMEDILDQLHARTGMQSFQEVMMRMDVLFDSGGMTHSKEVAEAKRDELLEALKAIEEEREKIIYGVGVSSGNTRELDSLIDRLRVAGAKVEGARAASEKWQAMLLRARLAVEPLADNLAVIDASAGTVRAEDVVGDAGIAGEGGGGEGGARSEEGGGGGGLERNANGEAALRALATAEARFAIAAKVLGLADDEEGGGAAGAGGVNCADRDRSARAAPSAEAMRAVSHLTLYDVKPRELWGDKSDTDAPAGPSFSTKSSSGGDFPNGVQSKQALAQRRTSTNNRRRATVHSLDEQAASHAMLAHIEEEGELLPSREGLKAQARMYGQQRRASGAVKAACRIKAAS